MARACAAATADGLLITVRSIATSAIRSRRAGALGYTLGSIGMDSSRAAHAGTADSHTASALATWGPSHSCTIAVAAPVARASSAGRGYVSHRSNHRQASASKSAPSPSPMPPPDAAASGSDAVAKSVAGTAQGMAPTASPRRARCMRGCGPSHMSCTRRKVLQPMRSSAACVACDEGESEGEGEGEGKGEERTTG